MRHMTGLLMAGLLFAASTAGAAAQTEITLSSDPQQLVIGQATAGLAPQPAVAGTTYTIEVTQTSSITVRLDAPLPEGMTLRLELEWPDGASGAGEVELTTSPQTVILSIPPGVYTGLGMTFELSAAAGAGVVTVGTRQVVFEVVTQL